MTKLFVFFSVNYKYFDKTFEELEKLSKMKINKNNNTKNKLFIDKFIVNK